MATPTGKAAAARRGATGFALRAAPSAPRRALKDLHHFPGHQPAVGRNRDGSRDIGLMQINSSWLPTLAGHGIAEHHLFDACTSIHVGAWILAGNVSRLGYTWEAVGAYNARSAPLRRAYAHKVHRELMATTAGSARRAASNPSPARLASASPAGSTRGLQAQ